MHRIHPTPPPPSRDRSVHLRLGIDGGKPDDNPTHRRRSLEGESPASDIGCTASYSRQVIAVHMLISISSLMCMRLQNLFFLCVCVARGSPRIRFVRVDRVRHLPF